MCDLSEENKVPLQEMADQLHDMLAERYPREHVTPYFCDCRFGAHVYFADIDKRHGCCVSLPIRRGNELDAMHSVRDGFRDWHETQRGTAWAA